MKTAQKKRQLFRRFVSFSRIRWVLLRPPCLTMGLLASDAMIIPNAYARAVVALLLLAATIVILNNALMEITPIRLMWRRVLLGTKLLALCAFCFMIVWPVDLLTALISLGVVFGFVDPRLHLASVQRAPNVRRQVFFSFGALCHHCGGVLLLADLFQPTVLRSKEVQVGDILTIISGLGAVPIVIVVCELLSWAVEMQVLTHGSRTRKGLFKVVTLCWVMQLVSFVTLLLFGQLVTAGVIPMVTVFIGNAANVLASLVGQRTSTWELVTTDGIEGSVARFTHIAAPLDAPGNLEALSMSRPRGPGHYLMPPDVSYVDGEHDSQQLSRRPYSTQEASCLPPEPALRARPRVAL